MRHILKLLTNKRGATAIEYALVACLISVAAIVSYDTLGDRVENSFQNTADKL